MRVAVFTSLFPSLVNTFFAHDVRGLLDAGIDVEVFATHPLNPAHWAHVPDVLSEKVFRRDRVHHLSLTRAVVGSLRSARAWSQAPAVAAVAASGLRHGPGAFVKSAYVVAKALEWARCHGGRFDHVLAYWGNYAGTCAYLFHRASGRDVPFSTFLHAGTDLYRSRVHLLEKLEYADNIIVVCEFNRHFLQATYPSTFERLAPKIYLHHIGVDVERLKLTADGRPANRIIAVGGLHRAKGFDDLLRAAAILHGRGRELEVVVVGGGPERSSLERLAEQRNISTVVKFSGWQLPEQALDAMRDATVLVHPSIGLGDAVPTVIKEAMAMGLPVVASRVAGIPELLDNGQCGVLTEPGDPEGLAAAIAALLDSPDRRQHYAIHARRRAEQMFNQVRNGRALAARLRDTRRHVADGSLQRAVISTQAFKDAECRRD